MSYSVEILLEQKTLLEDEMRFAEGKELAETKQRYADVCIALNKLNLPDVSQQSELLNDFLVKLRRLLNFTHSRPLPKYVEFYLKGIL